MIVTIKMLKEWTLDLDDVKYADERENILDFLRETTNATSANAQEVSNAVNELIAEDVNLAFGLGAVDSTDFTVDANGTALVIGKKEED